MNVIQKPLPKDQFFHEETRKTQIVLHYTAGPTIQSAFDWWKQTAERVATAYLIDLNGDVYQTFPEEYWAWHLGVGAKGMWDKASIGIELVNPGPLTQDVKATGTNPNALYTWYNKKLAWPADQIVSTRAAMPGSDQWRGVYYHAKFPNAQVIAAAELCLHLGQKHGIPCSFSNASSTLSGLIRKDPQIALHKGICSHSNYLDSKTDLGPWFPWADFFRELSA